MDSESVTSKDPAGEKSRIASMTIHPETLPTLQAWFEHDWPEWYGPGGNGDNALMYEKTLSSTRV